MMIARAPVERRPPASRKDLPARYLLDVGAAGQFLPQPDVDHWSTRPRLSGFYIVRPPDPAPRRSSKLNPRFRLLVQWRTSYAVMGDCTRILLRLQHGQPVAWID